MIDLLMSRYAFSLWTDIMAEGHSLSRGRADMGTKK